MIPFATDTQDTASDRERVDARVGYREQVRPASPSRRYRPVPLEKAVATRPRSHRPIRLLTPGRWAR